MSANKIISIVCEGGQNFTIVAPELSADKVAKQIRDDIQKEGGEFLDINAYVPAGHNNPGLFARKSKVIALLVLTEEQATGKGKILVPQLGRSGPKPMIQA